MPSRARARLRYALEGIRIVVERLYHAPQAESWMESPDVEEGGLS
jgi:hypothetical protein